MASFTAKDVMTLREMSGAGMMDCKKALTECDGDMEKAVDYLREKSLAKSIKKADRIAAEGIVTDYIIADKGVGVIVEVNSETDFVAKNDSFKDLVKSIAKHIAVKAPACVKDGDNALLDQTFVDDESKTVSQVMVEAIAKIGEKLDIRRFVRYEIDPKSGVVESYVHFNGKIGVLIRFTCDNAELAASEAFHEMAHNVAMHIVASKPTVVDRSQVDAEEVERERKIVREREMGEAKPKPANIIEKIVEGSVHKYYAEVCLLEQAYVRDPSMTVEAYIASVSKGAKVAVAEFALYQMGEGLQKRNDNFAEEVMSQTTMK